MKRTARYTTKLLKNGTLVILKSGRKIGECSKSFDQFEAARNYLIGWTGKTEITRMDVMRGFYA